MTTFEVLHIVPAAFDRERGVLGGAERYALELARAMANRVRTGLLTFGERSDHHRLGNLDIVVERALFVRGQRTNPWTPKIVSWVARSEVVHCHQRAVVASSTAALAARLLRRPVFVTDLGGGGWDVSAYLDTGRWFDGHLHISEYSRAVSGHSTRPDAHVILGGVDHQRFSPAQSSGRNGPVLYVGRLLPHKGINYLVEAVGHDIPLRIIGMPYDDQFLGYLKRLSAGKRVEFQHGITDDELISAYRSASVVVLPSVYRTMYDVESRVPELLGQTLLEAMACEAPVICTNVASMPEIVLDGVTGFVVPPNDPAALRERIEELLANPALAREMGMAGRRRVLEHFDWMRVVDRCLTIYRKAGARSS